MGGCFSSAASSQSDDRPTANVISANGDLRKYTVRITVSQLLHMEFPTSPASSSPSSSSSSSSSSSNSAISESRSAKFFVCNSDSLYYDEFIPALDGEYQLQADHIYFVLPISKLHYRLAASDMAALAVKATLALQNYSKKPSSWQLLGQHPRQTKLAQNYSKRPSSLLLLGQHRRQTKLARVSPVFFGVNTINTNSKNLGFPPPPPPSKSEFDGGELVENYYDFVNREEQITRTNKGFSDSGKHWPPPSLGASGSASKLQRHSSSRRRAKPKKSARSFRVSLYTIYEEGSVLPFF